MLENSQMDKEFLRTIVNISKEMEKQTKAMEKIVKYLEPETIEIAYPNGGKLEQ